MNIAQFKAKVPFCQMARNIWAPLQTFLKRQPASPDLILQKSWGKIESKPLMLAVVVSNSYDVDIHCDNTKWADEIANVIAHEAGGAIWLPGKGKYLSDRGVLSEGIHIILAFYSSVENQMESLEKVCLLTRRFQRERKEESIAIFVNGKLYLVS